MKKVIKHCLALFFAVISAQAENRPFGLPDWFEQNRVQAHSEHSLEIALRLTPEKHAEVIRDMGAKVLTRIYLSRDEGAWWQSEVGEIHPLIGDREFGREISEAVHSKGMKVIAYHRHMSDAAMQREHPSWICRLPDGSPFLEPRGKTKTVYVLCLNSPYRQYIKTRLIELAERGVDGIYFDNRHMPDICTCPYCLSHFRAKTGHEMDYRATVGSPGYMEAVQFVNDSMVEAFLEWRNAVHQINPDIFFCIKSSLYPAYFSPHMDYNLLAISDTSGTEFHKPFGHNTRIMASVPDFAAPAFDDQVALGWSIVRDTSQGRPPLMWVPHIRSKEKALYSASAALTYGCVAAMNMSIRDLAVDGPRNAALFSSTLAMGEKLSPYLSGGRPIPSVCLHISERSRNARLGDQKLMWQEVFGPALGAYEVLKESHLPWVTISDLDLAKELDSRTQVLVLPWPKDLTQRQRETVNAFETRGGHVLRLDPFAGWSRRSKKSSLKAALLSSISEFKPDLPVQIEGPGSMHAVSYAHSSKNRMVVALTNTWGWFKSTRDADPELNEGKSPPEPCRGVKITFGKEAGRPKKVLAVLTEEELEVAETPTGWEVRLQEFQINACVVAEY